MLTDADIRQNLASNGLSFVRENSWQVKKDQYLALVDRLTDKNAANCTNSIRG
jgi:hypothetical protein